MGRFWWLGLAVVLGAACRREIAAQDYPRTCTTASDCVLVASGDPCGCSCPSSAIRADAEADYRRDWEAAQRWCNPLAGQCLADCVAFTAECSTGTCVAREQQFGVDGGP